MQKKVDNKAMDSGSTKSEEPDKKKGIDFSFPKYNKIINAPTLEEARKKLNQELGIKDEAEDKE